MRRMVLALTALAIVGMAASQAAADYTIVRYADGRVAGNNYPHHSEYFREVRHVHPVHPGWEVHPRYFSTPPAVVVEPQVVVPAPVIVAPPVRYYPSGCGPRTYFQYRGRGLSIGVGF